MKRIIGIIIILVGLGGIVLSGLGIYYSGQIVSTLARDLSDTLSLTNESLDTVQDTLALTQTTVDDVSDTLDTADEIIIDVSNTISGTVPMLNQINQISSENVPDSVDAVLDALPTAAEVAREIDNTLRTLSAFEIDEQFLGFSLEFDLGVEYDPPNSPEASVLQIGESLEGLSEGFRGLEEPFADSAANLDAMSTSIAMLSEDISAINSNIQEVGPLVEEYDRIIDNAQDGLAQAQTNLDNTLQMVQTGLTVLLVWLALSQLAPIYVGWELVTGQRDDGDGEEA